MNNLQLNDELLEYLLKEREKDNTLKFGVRIQNNKNRLEQGYWFPGDGNYLWLSFYKKGDSKNKTKTIGLVFKVLDNGTIITWIEVVYKSESNPDTKRFYEVVKRAISETANLTLEENDIEKPLTIFKLDVTYQESVDLFLKKIKPKIDDLIINFELEEDFFFSDSEFIKNIDRINEFRNKKKQVNLRMETSSQKKQHLNQILYGPPGTGKTFNTINKALSIIEPKTENEIKFEQREDLKEKFDDYIKNGQIVFTTFHQSMSYEDFIEGIKPVKPDDNDLFLKYNIQDGLFKFACANAAYLCYKKYQKIKRQTFNYTFDDLYDAFIEKIQESLKNNEPTIYKTLTGKDVTVIEINSNDSIKARAKNSIANRKPAPLTKENLQKLYDKFNNVDEIKTLKQVRETVEISPRITEFYAIFKGLKEFESKEFKPDIELLDENIEIESYDIDEVIKKFNAGVYTNAIKEFGKSADPVVLIIDEINRGNISQIFGELITLLEEDKRLGKNESLEVILPYSKEKFGIPPNLYIIGTMNTADRSVESLDTALRRRFSFTEMMPEPNTLYGKLIKDIALDELLKVINERVEILLDRDHTIGHSYFIKLEKDDTEGLKQVFKNCIIPLFQEYFYGDYEKIGLIIGKDFFEEPKKYNKDIFASFYTQQYPENGSVLRLKEINDDFDIIKAVQSLLNIKSSENIETENE